MSPRHLLAPPLLAAHRLARLLTRRAGGVRLLLLHDVPPSEMAALDHLLSSLGKTGRLGSPRDYGSGRACCILTFDDGFASNLEAAALLERHGARGIFFVCPGLMALPWDEQRAAIAANVFDGKRRPEDIPERMRLMTWDELRDLEARGHVIGSHTLNHRRLTGLAQAEMEDEIRGSSMAFEREMGRVPEWFAFPFGDIDSVNAGILHCAGRLHRYCRSGIRGANGPDTHRLAVLADHVDLAAPPAYRMLAAEGGMDSRYSGARERLKAMCGG